MIAYENDGPVATVGFAYPDEGWGCPRNAKIMRKARKPCETLPAARMAVTS
jgi:hypothetical protein